MSTRDQILDAALLLFTESGFTATSVSAVRQEAGVSNGSFFHAFSSKEELGAALYLRSLNSYHEHIIQALSPDAGAAEGIASIVRAHVEWVVDEVQQAQFLFGQSQTYWINSVREQQGEANERMRKLMSTWSAPHVETKSIIQLTPVIMGAQLIGPTQLVCRAWLSGRVESDPREHLEQLVLVTQRALLIGDF